jgi:D-alanine-D-alanine ligase
MSRKLNITVMLGGPSAEREVSLRSGAAVAQALRSLGHEVVELDPRTPDWILPPKTEVIFLALHGTYGEDGTVQRQLDFLSVPYTGCDAEASAVAFDKIASKVRFLDANVPTAKYWWADAWTDDADVQASVKSWAEETAGAVFNEAKLSLPLVVKPACQGSSVGLFFVERKEDLATAVFEAYRIACDGDLKNMDAASKRSAVLIEEKIVGRETTVGILGGKVLPVVEVRPKTGSYDYQNKYTAGATEYFCPAEFDAATTRRIQDAALGAFQAVGGRDYARVDVMVRADGSPVVLEVNTLPGMTETSLLPKAAAAAGMNYAELCQRMVDLALARKAAAELKAEQEMAGSTVIMTQINVV